MSSLLFMEHKTNGLFACTQSFLCVSVHPLYKQKQGGEKNKVYLFLQ